MRGADIRKNGCDVCWPMFLKSFHQCCRLRTWANSFTLLSSSSTNTIWIIQSPRAGEHERDRTAAQSLHPAAAAVEVWGLVNRGSHRSRLADARPAPFPQLPPLHPRSSKSATKPWTGSRASLSRSHFIIVCALQWHVTELKLCCSLRKRGFFFLLLVRWQISIFSGVWSASYSRWGSLSPA